MATEALSRTPTRAPSLRFSAIFLRAAVVAVAIGSALTLINQAPALFGSATLERLPMVLVYLTPFVVVTISQILGIQQARAKLRETDALQLPAEPFRATIAGHGIPFRALLTGLIAGSVNASIMLFAQLLSGGEGDPLPFATLAQAYVLPMLFGALSQALSYRRAIAAFVA